MCLLVKLAVTYCLLTLHGTVDDIGTVRHSEAYTLCEIAIGNVISYVFINIYISPTLLYHSNIKTIYLDKDHI